MSDDSRIEELRRRIRKDPASIAFAQLAEELRRAGQFREAVEVCTTGLAIYPEYLSARVTLGRSLIELDRLDEARAELEKVRGLAPENLAAIRALAEIHSRWGGAAHAPEDDVTPVADVTAAPASVSAPAPARAEDPDYLRVVRTVAALESWLDAIHAVRAQRSA